MAIITNLQESRYLFLNNQNLLELYEFLLQCLDNKTIENECKKRKTVEFSSGAFAMFQTYRLKSSRKAFFETHKKYIDFQLTLKGAECFFIGYQKDFIVKQEYNDKKDLIIYHAKKGLHKIIANKANLCIFFPNDVHAGGLKHKEIKNKNVAKVVIKVPVELFRITM